jgi:hypothetical protein
MTAMRNPDAKHIDFAEFVGLIPHNPKFLPSNLDMVLERKGKFLVGEWKRPSESISRGQEILLERLSDTGLAIVLIIEGDTDEQMIVNKIQILTSAGLEDVGETLEDLKNIIRNWYEWADKKRIS